MRTRLGIARAAPTREAVIEKPLGNVGHARPSIRRQEKGDRREIFLSEPPAMAQAYPVDYFPGAGQ